MKTLVSLLRYASVCLGVVLCFSSNAFAQDTIYSEDFSGSSGVEGSLNGTAEDAQGELWIANGFATENGELATGQFEGSALLPFDPVVGAVYTLSMDVTTGSDRWLGIGFSNEGSTGMLNVPQDRFAQNGGIGWFLLRPNFNLIQQVEVFGGFNTMNVIPDSDTNFAGPVATRTMEIVLDTMADMTGASFEFDCLIDGTSVSFGPQTVPVAVDDINFVGFTFEGPTGNGDPSGPPISVANFLLTGPADTDGMLGDINCDGVVDLLDVGPFVELITNNEFSTKGDINLDGAVTLLDVGPFVALLIGG